MNTTQSIPKVFIILVAVLATVFIGSICFFFGLTKGLEAGKRPEYEYQVILDQDSIRIYNNGRYVGATPWDNTAAMSEIFIKDNE